MDHESFPRQQARTQRFTLGRPRSFSISPSGDRVLFIRSAGGADPVGRLWELAVESGIERELVVPTDLLAGGDEQLPPEERARRERMREAASGVVSYSTDRECQVATFALSGRLFVTDLASGASRELPATSPVVDPRVDPSGRYVAYCSNRSLRVVDVDGSNDRALVESTEDHITWGLADFIAAEELGRARGFWWSPSGDALLVERVDDSPVDVWWVSDPAHPDRPPVSQRYPSAGTDNANVSLWLVPVSGTPTAVDWETSRWEYLAAVHWSKRGAPLIQLLTRDQRECVVLTVDTATGRTQAIHHSQDPQWLDVHSGVPAWDATGQALLTIEPIDNHYALCVDGKAVSPPGVQVRAVIDVGSEDVMFVGTTHPTQQHVWTWDGDTNTAITAEAGVHAAVRGANTTVVLSADLQKPLPIATYRSTGVSGVIESFAESPCIVPSVTLLPGDDEALRVAVLLPSGSTADGPLPVLLDPYGGPHGQRVQCAQGAFRESQWWANQGFAVVVVDGRGTPGTPNWERSIDQDLAAIVLADQVAGLAAAAKEFPQLDLDRVAIRGWSFGGYLAALAVLDRPDVFHAAVAGAPVTDWRLYDTAYTERYLGDPRLEPDAYQQASLLDRADRLTRPLMVIHGLADDNVFVAHSLKLSARLTAAGKPHTVLPLSGVTHMASQEAVAENLLLLQVEFLRRALVS